MQLAREWAVTRSRMEYEYTNDAGAFDWRIQVALPFSRCLLRRWILVHQFHVSMNVDVDCKSGTRLSRRQQMHAKLARLPDWLANVAVIVLETATSRLRRMLPTSDRPRPVGVSLEGT